MKMKLWYNENSSSNQARTFLKTQARTRSEKPSPINNFSVVHKVSDYIQGCPNRDREQHLKINCY